MSYTRVIPRDLFNEAKLLKCLGRLALLIHNELTGGHPLKLLHRNPTRGFEIEQNQDDGTLYCRNLKCYCRTHELTLVAPYNAKDPYPLLCYYKDEEGYVFDDDGELNPQFLEFLAGLK
jgi:hypothetical protein